MTTKLPPFEVGTKFGEWTVIEQLERQVDISGMKHAWFSRARCVCGTEKILANNYLRAGHSHGCGCRRGQALARSGITHNKSRTPTYRLWQHIKERLKVNPSYRHVKLHEPWQRDFLAFEAFIVSLGPKPTPEHTLDRIESGGDYAPGNLRWADKTTQSLNRRNSMLGNIVQNSMVRVGQKYDMLTVLGVFVRWRHGRNWYAAKVECECGTVKTVYQKQLLSPKTKSCGCKKNWNLRLGPISREIPIEIGGVQRSMASWAREKGVSRQVLWQRINRRGWNAERAISASVTAPPRLDALGESLTLSEWSRRTGVPVTVIRKRLKLGWHAERAVTTPARAYRRGQKLSL